MRPTHHQANESCLCHFSLRTSHFRRGFTLIEVLLALTLTGLVLTATGSMTRQLLIAQRDLRERQREDLRRAAVFDSLRRDLERLLSDTSSRSIEIPPSSEVVIRLTSLARVYRRNATQRPMHPVRVTYRRKREEAEDAGFTLIRTQEDLTQPRGKRRATTRVLARQLATITVRVHDGQDWHASWPPARRNPPALKAVEIRYARLDQTAPTVRRVLLSGDNGARPASHDNNARR